MFNGRNIPVSTRDQARQYYELALAYRLSEFDRHVRVLGVCCASFSLSWWSMRAALAFGLGLKRGWTRMGVPALA